MLNWINSNNYKYNVKIEHIQPDDIKIIAKLYRNRFKDHFLGHMGHKFLELFISEFVNCTGNYGYVAKLRSEPVGFILATTQDDPFNRFYRKNFVSLVLITVSRYFQDPFIRKNIRVKG